MRSEFVEVDTIEAAEAACPWAAKIIEVEGGYHAFESMADFETWQLNAEDAGGAEQGAEVTRHPSKTATLSELITRIDQHGDGRWWDVIGVSIEGLDEAVDECEASDDGDMTPAYNIAANYARAHADDLYCVCWPDHVTYPLYDSDATYRLIEG